MLRRIGALAVVMIALMVGASSQASSATLTDADRSGIQGVIEAQLAAFRRGDAAGAFRLASPSIQQQFGTALSFMAMVRTAYLPVYRPREVEFRRLIEVRGKPAQLVLLVAPDFEVVTAYYLMEKQPDGAWRIDGCLLRRTPERAL